MKGIITIVNFIKSDFIQNFFSRKEVGAEKLF